MRAINIAQDTLAFFLALVLSWTGSILFEFQSHFFSRFLESQS